MENKEFAIFVAGILEDEKAEDVVIIDIAEKSGFADYFVICTVNSMRRMDTLSREMEDRLDGGEYLLKNVEGRGGEGWVLMDYGDIIINIFLSDTREHYQLEKVWSDCDRVEF